MNFNFVFDINSIVFLIVGMVICAILFSIYTVKLKKEIKMIKRQYEKKSIGMDDSSLKVKTLENKIKTLEAALKKQMEK